MTEPSERPEAARYPPVYDLVTVLTLMLGGVFVPVLGWSAGVVLLWASPRWTVQHKIVATSVWPLIVLTGLAVGLATGTFLVGAAAAAVALAVVVLPVTMIWLLRVGAART